MRRWRLWIHDRRGASAIEYAIVAALISCGILVSLNTLTTNLRLVFSAITNDFNGGVAPSGPPPATPNGVSSSGG